MPHTTVGVIGSGNFAERHLRAYLQLPVEVVGIWGRNRAQLTALQRRYRVPVFDRVEELLRQQPDGVSICTPPHTHAAFTIAALEAGCEVLCEKPLALTLRDADRMIAAARRQSKLLLTGFTLRFRQAFQEFHRRVANGEIGDIRFAAFAGSGNPPQKAWFIDARTTSGVTLEYSIHKIDFLRWVFGKRAVQVSAEVIGNTPKDGMLQSDAGWIRFAGGGVGYFSTALVPLPFPRQIMALGTRGALCMRNGNIIRSDGGNWSSLRGVVPNVTMLWDNPLRAELAHFLACMRGVEPVVTAEDGRESLRIALAAQESSRRQRPVRL